MDSCALLDPTILATLDRIRDASLEHTWLPAAMIALLRGPIERSCALPSHIAQQIHGYLHVPVVRCSLVGCHRTQFRMTVIADCYGIAIRINEFHPPGILLDVLCSKYMASDTTHVAIRANDVSDTSRFGSLRKVYNGPLAQLCATSELLAASVIKIATAAKWIAECNGEGKLACILADLAGQREPPPVFCGTGNLFARVSDDCLIVGAPEPCGGRGCPL